MHALIELAIRRPVGVSVVVALVALFGLLAVTGIPIQLTPDIALPRISVSTVWPGASPEEVEKELLEVQEEALRGVPGVARFESNARPSSGSISMEFRVGQNMTEALLAVSNRLSQVPRYPENVREPLIEAADATGPPLAVLIIKSDDEVNRPVSRWRKWAEDQVVARYERIPGVGSVNLRGGQDREVQVTFDPALLASHGLAPRQVVGALRSNNVNISAGDFTLGKRRWVVRVLGEADVAEELESLVLRPAGSDGGTVVLGDVARVDWGLHKRDFFVLNNGRESLALLFFRESGYNVLEVTREIHDVTAWLEEGPLAERGLSIEVVADQTAYIEGALGLVRQNILLGGLLAALVLLAFLRTLRPALVVITAIPVSILATLLLMNAAGRSINVVSLAGMAFAVGMLIDASIVVLENIDTWLQRGASPAKAALEGTREVWGAVLASTLTTIAVFVPILGWQSEVGQLLRDVALAVSLAVTASLLVSITLIPSMAGKVLGRKSARETKPREPGRLRRLIIRQVSWIAASRLRASAVSVLGIGLALLLALSLVPKLEYLPRGNRPLLFGMMFTPPGYSLEEIQGIGHRIQGQLLPLLDGDQGDVPQLKGTFFVGSPSFIFMGARTVDHQRIHDLLPFVRGLLRGEPGSFGVVNQAGLFGRGVGGGRSIDLDIRGSDLSQMIDAGRAIMGRLMAEMPGSQARPIPSLDLGSPELQINPDREALGRAGLTVEDLGISVDALLDGRIVDEFSVGDAFRADVVLRADPVLLSDGEALGRAPIATPVGVMSLDALATLDEGRGPSQIRRIDRRRAITLQVTPPDEMPTEEAMERVRADVLAPLRASGALPAELGVDLSGEAGKLTEAKSAFGAVLLLAVIVTFLLLAALFEDFRAPLVILVSVPASIAGGVVALRVVDKVTVAGQPLDMMTALGFVMLVGIVVNNAILIVHGALQREREGAASRAEAVVAAVDWRIRPIFMSALTSVAGLAPLVIFPGFGSELYRGVGAVVLGGLALSTVVSIYLVPSVYLLIGGSVRRVGEAIE
jgi:hydrophobic/amphiphilic exporter-1 (mainly G- bacteria), HAE1 family